MLHLRLTVPTDRRQDVLDLLQAEIGTANIAVLPNCSIKPPGDVILADVARESADAVISGLRERRIDEVGTISLASVDTTISRAAERAEDGAPGEGSDAVIWEQVIRATDAESAMSVTYIAFLAIATVLASIAIVLDSAVLIVGAMVLGPEFGPMAAVAVGIVHRRRSVVRQAVLALVAGFAAAIAITTLLALAARGLGWIDASLADAARPQTGFIIEPDKWSLIVAFIAGIAGILSLTASRSGALVGVFISVTTVPAAGNVALAVALGTASEFWGSLLQLGINIGAILLAGILTMLVQRAVWRRVPRAAPRPAGVHHP